MKQRDNLDVQTNTRVTKVVFRANSTSKYAIGVMAVDPASGTKYFFSARKEVILAAGVYDTPKLLMLSGVGPKAHLAELGIPLVVALEGVGSHLIDDIYCPLTGPLLMEQPTRDRPWPNSSFPIGLSPL
jgi:choline oxidase